MTKRTLLLGLVLMLIAGGADRAWGISITETEPNDTLGTAFNLDGLFSTGANPNIVDAQTIPWVSIAGTGNGTFDYYSFTVNAPGSRGIFDIDFTTGGLNTWLAIWDSNFDLVSANGQFFVNNDFFSSPGLGDGSSNPNDSFIQNPPLGPGVDPGVIFDSAGIFYVGVAANPASALLNGGWGSSSGAPQLGQDYALQVSLQNATLVPMPGAAWGGLGLIAGFGLLRRRRPTVVA